MFYAIVLLTVQTTQALVLGQSKEMDGGQGASGEGLSESKINHYHFSRLDSDSHNEPFLFPRKLNLVKEREK